MASCLTHLRIAAKIKEKIKGIDLSYLMMGSIAPDSVLKDADQSALTLSPGEFYNRHLIPERLFLRSDMTRSFLWGYYFHLLTDRMWDEQLKPFDAEYQEKFQDSGTDFSDFIREEALAVDFAFLKENGYDLLEKLKLSDTNLSFFCDFDPERIYAWKKDLLDFYYKENQAPDRDYEYLNSELVDAFVSKAAGQCIGMLL